MQEREHFVWNVAPEIFEWGPLAPRWYGLLFATGFLIEFVFMERVFRREDRPVEDLSVLLLYMLGGTVIGARLGHILFYHPGYYLLPPREILQIWEGGLASHGGAIGVLMAVRLYAKNRPDQSYLWLLDRLSIFVGLWGLYCRLGPSLNQGVLFGLFLVGVFSARIVLEVFKAPQTAFAESRGMFSMGQWLSFPLIGLGIWLLFRAGTSEQARLADA